jgi:hypothetical protein
MDYELKAGNAKVINGFLPDKLPTKSGRNSPSEKLVFKEMLSKLSGSSLSKLGLGATLIQTDIKDNGIKNEVDDDEHTDAYQKLVFKYS